MTNAIIDVTLTPEFEQHMLNRAVAALDATRGISTDALESGAVQALVEAAREGVRKLARSRTSGTLYPETMAAPDVEDILREALAPFEEAD